MSTESMLEIVLNGSVSISALLLAVVGIILSQWKWVRKTEVETSFKLLTWYNVVVEIMATIDAILSFLAILESTSWEYFSQFYSSAVILFVVVVLMLPIGIILTSYKTLSI